MKRIIEMTGFIISENQKRDSAEYLFIKILCGKQLTQGVHF